MKIQIYTDDGKLLDTIEEVHVNLKSQFGMGKLLDKLLDVYKNKYMAYMYEKYKMERRSGGERRGDETSTQILPTFLTTTFQIFLSYIFTAKTQSRRKARKVLLRF